MSFKVLSVRESLDISKLGGTGNQGSASFMRDQSGELRSEEWGLGSDHNCRQSARHSRARPSVMVTSSAQIRVSPPVVILITCQQCQSWSWSPLYKLVACASTDQVIRHNVGSKSS